MVQMKKFKFTHKHKALFMKTIYSAIELDGSVFVSWEDAKGTHTVEYTPEQVEKAIKKGDWILLR
jgi:hypothetical protein